MDEGYEAARKDLWTLDEVANNGLEAAKVPLLQVKVLLRLASILNEIAGPDCGHGNRLAFCPYVMCVQERTARENV